MVRAGYAINPADELGRPEPAASGRLPAGGRADETALRRPGPQGAAGPGAGDPGGAAPGQGAAAGPDARRPGADRPPGRAGLPALDPARAAGGPDRPGDRPAIGPD